MRWSCPTGVDLDEVEPQDQPAPYPLLVTIGASDDDDVWLLNCEDLAVITITGDPTYGQDFARYLAAELACSPWSREVTVDCVGIAAEIAPMNPQRVRYHDAGPDLTAEVLTDAVDVAHMVTTSALKSGDLGQARAAAELAALSAPHEEIPRLDLAAVAAAEGHAREAQRILREDVCDRSDDGEAPMELPERTESIIASHDWLTRGEAAS